MDSDTFDYKGAYHALFRFLCMQSAWIAGVGQGIKDTHPQTARTLLDQAVMYNKELDATVALYSRPADQNRTDSTPAPDPCIPQPTQGWQPATPEEAEAARAELLAEFERDPQSVIGRVQGQAGHRS